MKNLIHQSAVVHRTVELESPVRADRDCVLQRRSRIGRYSYLSEGSFLGEDCSLGRFCSVARNAQIGALGHPTDWLSTHPFQYSAHHFRHVPEYKDFGRRAYHRGTGTVVGHDVWIGTNAVILRGLSVGHGAVIAAGAVVTTDVAPYEVVGGLPAKRLRTRFDAQTTARLLESAWWELDLSELDTLPFDDPNAALDALEARRR